MTVGKLLLAESVLPSFGVADCDAQILRQHLKRIKGLKFSVTTVFCSNQRWLSAKTPLQFESGL